MIEFVGEKSYNDNKYTMMGGTGAGIFSGNPYRYKVVSPYGWNQSSWGMQRPQPGWHARNVHQTIQLNNSLNKEAQRAIDAKEPKYSIWDEKPLETAMSQLDLGDKKRASIAMPTDEKRKSLAPSTTEPTAVPKASGFRKLIGLKSTEEKAVAKVTKAVGKGQSLRDDILDEEAGRWPDEQWRNIVTVYQEKVGMATKIADLRAR